MLTFAMFTSNIFLCIYIHEKCDVCRYVCIIEIIFSFQFCVLVFHLAIDEDIPKYIHNLVIAIYLKHILKSPFMSAQLTEFSNSLVLII